MVATIGVVAVGSVQAANPTSAEVLARVEKNYKPIRDYKVDVEITVNSPQLKMPPTKATIYYKRPDKVKVVAVEGFAVIPKDAIVGNPVEQIRANFNTAYAGSGKMDGIAVHVLKLVPKTAKAQGTVRLYVEKKRALILRTDSEVGDAVIRAGWAYTRVGGKYWLPSQIKVEMSGMMTPEIFDPDEVKIKPAKSENGTATVKFRNYRVNKGVPDSVFEEKKGSK